jgi:hypothetical protein
VLGPSRPVPRPGGRVRIAHFGGGFEEGAILAVHDEGRTLEVEGASGEYFVFELNPATARFLPRGDRHGPRLEMLGSD